MINTSQKFKDACNDNSTVAYREYIIIEGREIDVRAKLSETAFKDKTFIGSFNMKTIEFEAENNIDFKKKEFEYYISVNGEAIKIGRFITTEIKDSDTFEMVDIVAQDNALKFAVPYESSLNYKEMNVTLYDVLKEACNNAGVLLKNTSIENGSFIVESNQFETGSNLIGDVIAAIAGITGNFATIDSEGKLELLLYTDTEETIENYIELDDKRDTQPITTVVIGNANIKGQEAIRKDQALIDQYGEHFLVINDNPFAYTKDKREKLVDAIFQKVKGFSYSSFESKNTFKPYMTLGDKVRCRNKNGAYFDSLILKIEKDYADFTLSAPSIAKAAVDYKTVQAPGQIAKRAEIIADQAAGKITSVVEQIGDRSGKKTTITQDIEKIQSEISDIAEVTVTKQSENARLDFTGINTSEPLKIEIYPILENISFLYPYSKIFPSNKLFSKTRTIQFKNTKDGTIRKYELGANLLYFDAENYDRFVFNYEDKTCKIHKKVGYNADGTTRLLDKPEILSFPFPTINLTEGDYEITLLGYTKAYMNIQLMSKNIYTDQFSTKIETSSKIEQSAKEINLSVNKKLELYSTTTEMNAAINISADNITSNVSRTYETKDNAQKNYSEIKQTTDGITSEVGKKVGNNEIISKINQSSEAVQIEAGKISLNGKTIDMTSGNININSNNFKVDKYGNMTCANATMSNADIINGKINIKTGSASTNAFNIINQDNNSEKSIVRPTRIETNGTGGDAYIIAAGSTSSTSALVTRDGNGYATFKPGRIKNDALYYNTSSSSPNIRIDSDGEFYRSTNTSSRRYKTEITEKIDAELDPHKLYKLKIKQFKYKPEYQPSENDIRYNKNLIGFIAEEVAEVYPIAVDYEGENIDNWNERYIIPGIIKLLQEQQEELEKLRKEIAELKASRKENKNG